MHSHAQLRFASTLASETFPDEQPCRNDNRESKKSKSNPIYATLSTTSPKMWKDLCLQAPLVEKSYE